MPQTYPVPTYIAARAHITAADYQQMYQASLQDPDTFWSNMATQHIDWLKTWDKVQDWDYTNNVHIAWFSGAELNVCANCVDRHLPERADKPAIIWEGDDPATPHRTLTYRDLYTQVCQAANALKALGVTKGDRVCLYMPMVPEAAITMLACARIGAIHSVVFGGFSAEALRERIAACGAKVVVTADEGIRGGKVIPLKNTVDSAIAGLDCIEHTLVLQHTQTPVASTPRDVWWHNIVPQQHTDCPAVPVASTDPLFILYTSGSTGKPKGVVHGSGGYLLYAAMTHKYIFDIHENDIYWCSADVGWITGHSYVVYGPLANGATTVMFEGVPNHPDWSRFWQVIDKNNVTVFYTAPTAIRSIEAQGDAYLHQTQRTSLRILGTVGEPINPEVWAWYHRKVGNSRCPIVDTWWQTETGGIMITPLPGVTPLKPGSATKPFFGIEPVVLDEQGQPQTGAAEGYLCIKRSWPGQMMTVWGDHDRFKETYFSRFPGYYFSGDGCRRDADGDYWITGRVDDVLNTAGHRLGTAEVESALVLHEAVSEAAVVGAPHAIKGEGIYAFVTLHTGYEPTDDLRQTLVQLVRKEIGPVATPDAIQWAPGLPKTRSGKIMRRILRKIVHNKMDELGDTSTLADPTVVDNLYTHRIEVT